MRLTLPAVVCAVGIVGGGQGSAAAQGTVSSRPARQPDLSSINWIRMGAAPATWNDWVFTEEGKKRFDAYDFRTDDPGFRCVGASPTRVWLSTTGVVKFTQGTDFVRVQYEWMDIDRRIPLVDPLSPDPKRSNVPGHPAFGYSAAWYDGDTLVIDTVDYEPGYITTMNERAGMPQSRRMHTVERLRREGKILTIETTHVDPANYRTPVLTTIPLLATDWELMEYGCTPEEASVLSPR